MIKRLVIVLICVGVLLFAVFGFGAFKAHMIKGFIAKFSNPPQTVAIMVAQTTPWQPKLTAVGSLRAVNGASISAQTAGIVDKVMFTSGQTVPAGAVLLTLRPNNDDAVLAQLQATADLDAVNYQRDLQQFHADAVAKSTVDTDHATLLAAQAQVASQKALMAEKIVAAPFAGKIGIRQVDVGQYLAAGTAIATLQQLDPIYVDFYLPQQDVMKVQPGQTVSVAVDAYGDQEFAGSLKAVSSSVDSSSRMVQMRAQISNPHDALLPGMFATAAIDVGAPENLITLPQTAISYNAYGDTVFVVDQTKDAQGKDELTAKQVFVTLGDTRGDQVAILKGVSAGEQVVVAGQVKLHNGSIVLINNKVLPSDSPNPLPTDK